LVLFCTASRSGFVRGSVGLWVPAAAGTRLVTQFCCTYPGGGGGAGWLAMPGTMHSHS